jgi:uncharacterized membrane protein
MLSVNTKRVLWRFLLFACFGLLIEVFFTALGGIGRGRINLVGHTSPWMMIDYGLLGLVLMPIANPLIRRNVPLPVRAIVYMLAIFFVELVSGWFFDLCGIKIWDYSHLRYNIHGYITAMYAPFWFGLGLVVEAVYRRIDATALLFATGTSGVQLENLLSRKQD